MKTIRYCIYVWFYEKKKGAVKIWLNIMNIMPTRKSRIFSHVQKKASFHKKIEFVINTNFELRLSKPGS